MPPSRGGQVLLQLAVPKDATPAAWARTAATVTAALSTASPSIRRAGAQRVMQAFSDEVFRHLDPYSRYVPPDEIGEDHARRAGRFGITVTRRGTAINGRLGGA